MRVLVTAFEPFGKWELNSSGALLERLAGTRGVETVVLPVSYGRVESALREAIERAQPEVVVALGQADGRARITVERVALNADEATSIDNDEVAGGARIVEDGPVGYWSTLPVDELVTALRDAGIPAAPSRDAGGYLCNHTFYRLMHLVATERPDVRAGFVHVPVLPEQTTGDDVASMSLDTLERAARLLLDTLARVYAPAS
jgi:pyroglutamyl-peptidase